MRSSTYKQTNRGITSEGSDMNINHLRNVWTITKFMFLLFLFFYVHWCFCMHVRLYEGVRSWSYRQLLAAYGCWELNHCLEEQPVLTTECVSSPPPQIMHFLKTGSHYVALASLEFTRPVWGNTVQATYFCIISGGSLSSHHSNRDA